MNALKLDQNRRILVIDDNPAIHEDFRKILVGSETGARLDAAEIAVFGEPTGPKHKQDFAVDFAFQGLDGVAMVAQARHQGRPYAMAFVDVRMPPGMDGVETTLKLWEIDPDLQVVICTAYSDYSWGEMLERIGHTDRMVILKKPFDTVEVLQLAHTLTTKWLLSQESRNKLNHLEELVAQRTADLRQTNDQLKAHIEERNRLQQQLLHSQKMEAIGRLAGGVAHDFNNILTAISGFTELTLERLEPTDPSWSNLEQVRLAAERAATLTRQLLAFSRKQIMRPKVLDINQVLVGSERMLARLIGEHIELITIPGQALGHIKADPGQIEQVLMNLAINARDAMPQGGTLTLETANFTVDDALARRHDELNPGEYVLLTMTDTGIGMIDEVKSRVFEPFFTTKELGQGTGLGLATCFGIAKQSGGYISVESKPNHGTTFRLYLPRIAAVEEPASPPDSASAVPRGTETILLVEDAPAVRMYATIALEEQGYTVLTAGDGVEGLRIAKERNGQGVDLVVTDVVMPKMGGKALADHIHVMHPETKILFTSGYTEDAIVDHGVLNAGIAFLPKPYTPSVLARKVREMLNDHSPTRNVRAVGLVDTRNS